MKTLSKAIILGLGMALPLSVMAAADDVTISVMEMNEVSSDHVMENIELPDMADEHAQDNDQPDADHVEGDVDKKDHEEPADHVDDVDEDHADEDEDHALEEEVEHENEMENEIEDEMERDNEMENEREDEMEQERENEMEENDRGDLNDVNEVERERENEMEQEREDGADQGMDEGGADKEPVDVQVPEL